MVTPIHGPPPPLDPDPSEVNAADARVFLAEARAATTPDERRRRIAAAVYFALAAFEAAKERAPDDAAKKQVKAAGQKHLPHHGLLHDVRIQNFHRLPLPAPRANLLFAWHGPSESKANTAPQSLLSSTQRIGGSGRPVSMQRRADGAMGFELFDHDAGAWVVDDVAIEKFLDGVPAFLQDVAALIA